MREYQQLCWLLLCWDTAERGVLSLISCFQTIKDFNNHLFCRALVTAVSLRALRVSELSADAESQKMMFCSVESQGGLG